MESPFPAHTQRQTGTTRERERERERERAFEFDLISLHLATAECIFLGEQGDSTQQSATHRVDQKYSGCPFEWEISPCTKVLGNWKAHTYFTPFLSTL